MIAVREEEIEPVVIGEEKGLHIAIALMICQQWQHFMGSQRGTGVE